MDLKETASNIYVTSIKIVLNWVSELYWTVERRRRKSRDILGFTTKSGLKEEK